MYKCTICGHISYSQVDCSQHIQREHPESPADRCFALEYRCGFCGMTFPHQTDVKNHALRDHGIQRVEVIEVGPA